LWKKTYKLNEKISGNALGASLQLKKRKKGRCNKEISE
jgi:hypothetical protein